ncbi:MAG: hypothetical protein HQK67_04020, partial [Desulfamplus sp.]|nr:hypothetical protein [Desulfamplus sp.]
TQSHIQEELVNIWLSEKFTAVFVTHDVNEAILLGNKIILLGGYPGCVNGIYNIDDPYPRDVNTPEFKAYRSEILTSLKQAHVGNKKFFESFNESKLFEYSNE